MTWPDFFHAFVFVDDNGNWTIGLWHDRDPLDMELPAVVPLHLQANAQWTLYDQNGDQIDSGTAENNEVQINLKGYVSYLRFSVP